MSHYALMTEMEKLRHSIDVYSALVLACQHDTRPDVIEKRERLVASLGLARDHLKRLRAQGVMS